MTGIFVAFMIIMMRNEKEWWWWRKGMNDDGRLSSIVGSWLLRCSQECGEGRAGFSAVFTRPTGFASNFWQNCRFLFSPKDFPQFSFRLVSPEADLGSAFLDKNILWLNFKLALTIRILRDACCIILGGGKHMIPSILEQILMLWHNIRHSAKEIKHFGEIWPSYLTFEIL